MKIFGILTAVRNFISGYKTYLLCAATILTVAVAWASGNLSDLEAIKAITAAIGGITLRAAIAKQGVQAVILALGLGLALGTTPTTASAQTNAPPSTNAVVASGGNWSLDLSAPFSMMSVVGSNIDIGNGVGIPFEGKFGLKYNTSQGVRLGSLGKGNWEVSLEFIHSLEFGSETVDQIGAGLVTRHITTTPTTTIFGGITHTSIFQQWALSLAAVHRTDDLFKGRIRGDEARVQIMASAKIW
jgi:hypothetical protein